MTMIQQDPRERVAQTRRAVNLLQERPSTYSKSELFPDAPDSRWARNVLDVLRLIGVIDGYTEYTTSPFDRQCIHPFKIAGKVVSCTVAASTAWERLNELNDACFYALTAEAVADTDAIVQHIFRNIPLAKNACAENWARQCNAWDTRHRSTAFSSPAEEADAVTADSVTRALQVVSSALRSLHQSQQAQLELLQRLDKKLDKLSTPATARTIEKAISQMQEELRFNGQGSD